MKNSQVFSISMAKKYNNDLKQKILQIFAFSIRTWRIFFVNEGFNLHKFRWYITLLDIAKKCKLSWTLVTSQTFFFLLVAIKTKIKEVKIDNSDRKVILAKKRKAVKLGSLTKQDLKKLVLYLKNGADCPCQQLENLRSNYLIMGRTVGKQYILTGIHKWEKSSKEFKKALKQLESLKCPTFETVFKWFLIRWLLIFVNFPL